MDQNHFKSVLLESSSVKSALASDQGFLADLAKVARKLKEVATKGGTVYVCGNGGSACDSMHMVEELVARFKRERPGIRAMHFMDPAILTCWSNDYSYSSVFERFAKTFCGPSDALILISTSGNSENCVLAARAARERGTFITGFTGQHGGKIDQLCDVCLKVPSVKTERIQEAHIVIVHILCEALEN